METQMSVKGQEASNLLLRSLFLSGPRYSVTSWDDYCHQESRQTLQTVPANKEGLCDEVKVLSQMNPAALPDFVTGSFQVDDQGQRHS